ncbi:MAG: RdgB/HAM1 family non-canonical purine NTP pyrophosphatase, partial [Bacilli bacterium]
ADFEEIPEVEETGSTFFENAALKSETISNLLGVPVIADDSGLCVDVLDGAPGVYSARYAGEPKDDNRNNELLLENLSVFKENERSARFVCVLALSEPGEETVFFTGECFGQISQSPYGEGGFGYDPIFWLEDKGCSMAQLSKSEKNEISHRKIATDQLLTYLTKNKEKRV